VSCFLLISSFLIGCVLRLCRLLAVLNQKRRRFFFFLFVFVFLSACRFRLAVPLSAAAIDSSRRCLFCSSPRRLLTYKNVAPFLSFCAEDRGGLDATSASRQQLKKTVKIIWLFLAFLFLSLSILSSFLSSFTLHFFFLSSCYFGYGPFFPYTLRSWHLFVRVQQQRTDLPRLLVSTLSFSLLFFKQNNNDNTRVSTARLNRFFFLGSLLLTHLIELLIASNCISFLQSSRTCLSKA